MTYTMTDLAQAKAGALEDTKCYPTSPNQLIEEVYELNAKMFIQDVASIIMLNYNPHDPLGHALSWFHYGYAWRRYQDSINIQAEDGVDQS